MKFSGWNNCLKYRNKYLYTAEYKCAWW
jgi:hypothetical protein